MAEQMREIIEALEVACQLKRAAEEEEFEKWLEKEMADPFREVCKICGEPNEVMYMCSRCHGRVCRYHCSANAANDKVVCIECAEENFEE